MRRPEVADLRPRDEVADRPVHRDGVALGRDRAQAVAAVLAGRVLGAQPCLVDVGDLRLVGALGVGLPDVQHGADDGCAVQVPDHAGEVQRRAGHAVGHVPAVAELGGALDVEGPQHRRRGGRRVEPVVHLDDEHRQTQHVRGEDELLPLLVADLPGAGQPLHGRHPLRLGQPHLPGEVVQMAHQGGHEFGQPRVARGGQRSTARSVMLSSVTSCTGFSRRWAGGGCRPLLGGQGVRTRRTPGEPVAWRRQASATSDSVSGSCATEIRPRAACSASAVSASRRCSGESALFV